MDFASTWTKRRLVWGLCAVLALHGIPAGRATAQAETARPEIGKPLESAQALLKAQKPHEAMAKIKLAERVLDPNPYERYIIQRVRIQAALALGDADTAAKAYEDAAASDRMSAGERRAIEQALAGAYYRARQYGKAAEWAQRYAANGGPDRRMRTLLMQAYYQDGAYAQAANVAEEEIAAARKAGRAPEEAHLQLLAHASLKRNDRGAGLRAMEALLTYYPTPEHWDGMLRQTQARTDLSDRLLLDFYRLKLAVNVNTRAADYMEAAQLALRDGSPHEALAIVERGYERGLLGQGAEAERHSRLRSMVAQSAAESDKMLDAAIAKARETKDGDAMLDLGLDVLAGGRFDDGLRLMEEGVRTGRVKAPREAQLRLGIAYLRAGRIDQAVKTFGAVDGEDATAAVARLWRIYATHGGKAGTTGLARARE